MEIREEGLGIKKKASKEKAETRKVNKAITSQELRTALTVPDITKDDAVENIKAYNRVSAGEIAYWGEQDTPWYKGKKVKPIFTRIPKKFGTPKEVQELADTDNKSVYQYLLELGLIPKIAPRGK